MPPHICAAAYENEGATQHFERQCDRIAASKLILKWALLKAIYIQNATKMELYERISARINAQQNEA